MRTPYIYIYIYIYIYFPSNSRGLALLGPARPDKFINLASRGIKDILTKGKKLEFTSTQLLKLMVY